MGLVKLGRPSDSAMAFLGTYIGARLAGVNDLTTFGISTLALSNGLLSAGSMMFNDWHDVVEDGINRPSRPIPAGLVSRALALRASLFVFGAAIVLAAALGPIFGAGAGLVVGASVWYTLQLKARPWIGNTICALLSAYPLWCWLPVSSRPGTLYLAVAGGFVVMGVGREVMRTAFDADGDRAGGVRTVATSRGSDAAVRIGSGLMFAGLLAGWVPVAGGETSVVYGVLLAGSTLAVGGAVLHVMRARRLPARQSSGRLIVLARAVIVVMLIALAGACGGRRGTAPGAATPVIAVIPRGSTQMFWRGVRAGAMKAGQDLGVTVVWPAAFKENDADAQIDVVRQALANGATALALAPLDPTALAAPVAEAVRAGRPVVTFDSTLEGGGSIAQIGTDHRAAGFDAGARLGKILGGTGRVAMLRLDPRATSTMQREEGFLAAMTQFPGIAIVGADRFSGTLLENNYRGAHALLAEMGAERATLDAAFTSNESTTLGMLKALEDLSIIDQVTLVGFDRTPRLVNALETGEVDLLVIQNPGRIGYQCVETLVRRLRGEPFESRQIVAFALVDRASLSVPYIRALLQPHLNLER